MQPLCVLLKREVRRALTGYREAGGARVQHWLLGMRYCPVDLPDHPQAFCNINTPAMLREAASI
ncbi:MAG: hypothetical protein P8173_16635 [Gammaproteobacteria bacterium]